MILKKLISFKKLSIVGEVHKFSLEQRVLHGILLIGGIGTLGSAFGMNEEDLPKAFQYAMFLNGIASALGYFLSRFYGKYYIALLAFTFSEVVMLFSDWFQNGGLREMLPISYIVVLVISLQCFPKRFYLHIIIGAIFIFLSFLFLEFNFSHLRSTTEVSISLRVVHWIMMTIFTSFILILFRTQYEKWEIALKEKDEKLAKALAKEKELNTLKSQFISMVSHQFRTPLTAITSSTELIELYTANKLAEREKGKVDKQFNRIHESIKNVTTMMERVLAFGQVESDGVQFKPVETDLVKLLEGLIEKYPLEYQSEIKKLKVVGEPKQLLLDKNLIDHSISNLISNAIKYDPQKRFPEIILDFKKEHVLISVTDEGLGIPKEAQEKLFLPFYRAQNVANIKGTGIGLSVVKQFIEMHGGRIFVESEEYKGCRFNIFLPYQLVPHKNTSEYHQDSSTV
ncbi:sensor histidine kinase [Sediminitomix flava]|uniref:histidine kinase n=1 Tax=Sediminitomix flava TaxID=379075 RepID=A0A315ZBS6_SEDFL|nr:HAMP domain-containing sensor histidine kinase [Sediminitomix flava]PWJ43025.1 signal transduction histidine kinase [Sediminitomix flava]